MQRAVDFLFLLSCAWSRGADSLTVKVSGSPLIVREGEDAVLSCLLLPTHTNAESLEVRWFGVQDSLVHTYIAHRDVMEVQSETYKGRTSLFHEELRKGNVSLQLRAVRTSDEGLYQCCVITGQQHYCAKFELKLAAQGSTPSVSLLECPAGGGLSLLCVSEGWYPPPELLWTDETGADWRAHFTTNEEQDSTGLVTVRSQIHLPRQQGHAPRQQNTMICVVRSRDGATELKTVVKITEVCYISMQWAGIAISILAVVMGTASGVCVRRKSTKDSLKRDKETLGKEMEDLQKQNETLKQEKEKVEADFKDLRKNTNMCVYALGREWKKMTEAHVNVTLDPDTASPHLTVSEDGSRVRFTGERSAEWPSVLGREGFTSGRHYWEVEVGEKGYWVLGVSTHPHEKSIPEKPGEGYWLVRLFRGKTCTAVSQSGEKILKLEKICKVWGVYLDHEGGRLSFCNAETRFHIHTLEDSFPEPVYPIFSPGSHDKGPLIIQRVRHTAANFI